MRSPLRILRTHDTAPYCPQPSRLIPWRIDQDFSFKTFSVVAEIFHMQAPAINAARDLCEPRLPARDNAPAPRASFYRAFVLFRPLHSEGVSGSNVFFHGLEQQPHHTPQPAPAHQTANSATAELLLWSGATVGMRSNDSQGYPRPSGSATGRWASRAQ